MVTWDYEPNSLVQGTTDRKIVEDFVMSHVTPSMSAGEINYTLGFYNIDSVWLHDASGDVPFQSRLGLADSQPDVFINSVDKDDYITRSDIDLGFGDGWDSQNIKARAKTKTSAKINPYVVSSTPLADYTIDATLYTEIWSDYSSTNTTDYLLGGVWLLIPDKIEDFADTRMGTFGQISKNFGKVQDATTGTATYNGSMAGLHMTENEKAVPTIKRLSGDVSLTANFGTASEKGSIQGSVTNLKLDGESVTGSFSLSKAALEPYKSFRPSYASKNAVGLGNINGVNYLGHWAGLFHGDPNTANTAHPTGVVGTVGGKAATTKSSFVASFGAKKVENE